MSLRVPLALVLCAALSTPALAQQVLGNLFVSPAGQAFRGGGGLDAWWRQTDADGDGALSETEMAADFTRQFQVLDADHDGVIAPAEIVAYERAFPELRGRGGPPPGSAPPDRPPGRGGPGGMGAGGGRGGGIGGGPPAPMRGTSEEGPTTAYGGDYVGGGVRRAERPEGLGPYGLLNDPEPIVSADTDLSGSVTAAEFAARAHRVFGSLDMNGDGRLTRVELPEPSSNR